MHPPFMICENLNEESKMTKIFHYIAAATTLVASIPILSAPARAQQNGESRCGADGYVERYSSSLHSWLGTGSKCASNRGGHDNGGPVQGDTKCGADGKVYTYYPSMGWQGGYAACK